jgi:tyrosinase
MYPVSYLTPSYEWSGSYTIVPGLNSTLSTPLTPFSTNEQGDSYTSATSRSLSTFGYTYPEIQDWNQSTQQLRANVIAKVNSLYGPPSQKTRLDIPAEGLQVTEWSVAISVAKFGFDGRRFVVRIFLETVPENPQEWATSDSCIGSFAVLPPPDRMAGPMPDTLTYSEISLAAGLRVRGYDGQDIMATATYLKDHLQWKIQMVCLTQFGRMIHYY